MGSNLKRFLSLMLAFVMVLSCTPVQVFATEGEESGHGHVFIGETTMAPTCDTEGETTYICECGETKTEPIAALGHTYVDGVCSVCAAADPSYEAPIQESSDEPDEAAEAAEDEVKCFLVRGQEETTEITPDGVIMQKVEEGTYSVELEVDPGYYTVTAKHGDKEIVDNYNKQEAGILRITLVNDAELLFVDVPVDDGESGDESEDETEKVPAEDLDFTDAQTDEYGDGFVWDNANKVLTLNGAAITKAVVLPEGTTVEVSAGTENSVKVESGDAIYSAGALIITGSGKLTVESGFDVENARAIRSDVSITVSNTQLTAKAECALAAPEVTIENANVNLYGYYYGIHAKTTSGTTDSCVILEGVSGTIAGYGYGGINAHSETANVKVRMNDCSDLEIYNEVTNDSTSVNFNFAGIRAYTRGNGKTAEVQIFECTNVSISNSTMAILAANNANAACEDAAQATVHIEGSSGIKLTGNTSCYSAVFVNNYGIETDDGSNLNIIDSEVEVNAPNGTGLMTSVKTAPSEVDISGSELTVTAGATGIRTIAAEAGYADTDVVASEITFNLAAEANAVDESIGGTAVADETYADADSTITVKHAVPEIDLSKAPYTIDKDGEYVVVGGSMQAPTSNTLTIRADAIVTLDGVWAWAAPDAAGVSMISIESGDVTLNVAADSNLKGGKGGAGIYVAEGASVTIKGGKLTATGNGGVDTADAGAAGIGGTYANGNSGAITIDGATVAAYGYGVHGSGIGSGSGKVVGEIRIVNGANVTAHGGYYANGEGTKLQSDYGKTDPEGGAAIGGGGKTASTIANITIDGSTVIANGGSKAAGIGANFWCSAGIITISGDSNVTAQGGSSSAAIGTSRAGDNGVTAKIVISGGTVTATGGAYGAGIGGGYNADSLGNGADASGLPEISVAISGGTVTATGGEGGAGIGGGYKTDNVNIDITGGTVTAKAGALVSGKTVDKGGEACAIGSGANGSGKFENSPAVEIGANASVTVTTEYGGKSAIEGMTDEAAEELDNVTVTVKNVPWNGETIGSVEDLQAFAKMAQAGETFADKTITLTADIDMTGYKWVHIDANGTVVSDFRIPNFAGTFDGGDHTISNVEFLVEQSGDHRAMMFTGTLTGIVKNLKVTDAKATVAGGKTRVAAVANTINANSAEQARLQNVHVKNFTIDCNNQATDTTWFGALSVYTNGGNLAIKDCSVENFVLNANGVYMGSAVSSCITPNNDFVNVAVNGFTANIGTVNGVFGGFAGQTQSGGTNASFTDCSVTGLDFNIKNITGDNVGGFMSTIGAATQYYNCSVEGTIDVTEDTLTTKSVGGFIGDHGWNGMYGDDRQHEFRNCTVDVDITAVSANVGGFIGNSTIAGHPERHIPAYFYDCSAKGDVATTNGVAGGFVGIGDRGLYYGCSASGNVTGRIAGGFWGEIYPKTKAEAMGSTHKDPLSKTIVLNGCTATGTVSGTEYKAGLIGFMKDIYVNADNTLGYVTPIQLNSNYPSDYNRYAYPSEEDGNITVVTAVAIVDNKGYESFDEALEAAKETGKPMTVLAPVVLTEDATLDLTGVTINGDVFPVFRIQNGATVTVKGGTIVNGDYIFVLGASDKSSAGNLIIESGSYTGETTVASVTKGTLTVKGGQFQVTDETTYLLNCIDASYADGSAKIVVQGGSFVGFNPADNAAESGGHANFTAPGYEAKEENGVYSVVEWDYQIDNKEDLLFFAAIGKSGNNMTGKTVKLNADINFGWDEWYPFNFYGTLEGNNHTIKNLTYVPNPDGRMGFFQSIGGSAKDLTLDGVKGTVPANGRFGGFTRYLNCAVENIHVKNIEVTTTDTLAWVGGFTTYTAGGSTKNCSVENMTVNAKAGADLIAGFISLTSNRQLYSGCTVTGFKVEISDTHSSGCGVGGFVAQTQTGWNNPKFADCTVTGIDVTATGLVDVGGFIAWPGAHTEYANNCHTEGKIDVTGVTSANCFAGGFFGNLGWNADLGYMGHVVNNCSADVDIITKAAAAGGFVGSATNSNNASMYATFNSCSASGDITCAEGGTADIGGFAGDADRGVYNDCTASGTITNNGTGYAGQFVGAIYDVTPKYDGRYPAGTRDYPVDKITAEDCTYTGTSTNLKFIGNTAEGADVTIYVAKISEVKYASLAAAVAAAEPGATITMTGNEELSAPVVIDKNVTIDLNGKTITTAATEAGTYVDAIIILADVTVTGNGTIDARPSHGYSFYVGDKQGTAGTLTIKNGNFYGESSAVNNRLGTVTIEGGYFEVSLENPDDKYDFVINCIDENYNAGTAKIIVKGGSFKNFNPADNKAETNGANYVADGFISRESNGIYTVAEWDYTIYNKAELEMFRDMVNAGNTLQGKTVTLKADIDLAGINWTPIGNTTNYFRGTFDGQDHIISNMTINANTPDADQFAALFGGVKNAVIKNLTMKDTEINVVGKKVRAAAVVGIADSDKVTPAVLELNFQNITVDGCSITAEAKAGSVLVGGVVGYSYPANMSNITVSDLTIDAKAEGNEVRAAAINGYVCGQNISNNGNTRMAFTVDGFDVDNVTIKADGYTVFAGGYAPYTYYGYITLKNGTIDGLKITVDAHEAFVGGLVGYFWRSDNGHNVEDVHISGIDFDVTTDYLGETRVGGVVGTSQSPNTKYTDVSVSGKIVERCSNSANPVNHHAKVGGFVARTYEYAMQTYTNCVADVDVTGSNVAGGFVGNHTSTVSYVNCEAKGDVTANIAGGFAGRLTNSSYTSAVTFDACKVSGNVTGTNVAGGFIGSTVSYGWGGWGNAETSSPYANAVTIKDCIITGDVKRTNGETAYVAGVVGEAILAEGAQLTLDNVNHEVNPPCYPVMVAQVGNVKYSSLMEALNACTNGETVKLIADITYGANDVVTAIGGATGFGDYYNPAVIYLGGTKGATDAENKPSNVNAVLDLNGHSISSSADAYLFMIMDNAKLTFTDSVGGGSVKTSADAPVLWVVGTETLVTIQGGKYETASATGLIHVTHGGDLVITGGEFDTTADDASLLIMLNTLDRQNSKYFISGKATVSISGGTFHGFNPEKVGDDNGASSIEDIKFVDGCALGFMAVENEDGSYGVQPWDLKIYDVKDLMTFAELAKAGNTFSGKTVQLMADIDLEGATWTPIKSFAGTFDGGNHTISNFNLDGTKAQAGFFASLGQYPATVKNLTLSNVTGTAGNYRFAILAATGHTSIVDNVHIKDVKVTTNHKDAMVGAIYGYFNWTSATNCTIENFEIDATKGAKFIGGFAAWMDQDLTIDNVDINGFKVTVSDTDNDCAVGGFTAQTQTGHRQPTFVNCDITGLDVVASGTVDVGGFVGDPGAHTITNKCTVAGKIDATNVTNGDIGGFFADYGWNNNESNKGGHKLTNCSADVDITTKTAPAGGFIGSATNDNNRNMPATLTGCSATGTITVVEGGTANIGGFAGEADRGTYKNCTAAQEPFIGYVAANAKLVNVGSYVAQVGESYYADFDNALAIAKASEEKALTLLAPVVLTEDTTLDLTGVTITTSGNVYPAFRIQNNANVTVKGGNVTNNDYVFVLGASDGSSAGNLTIESGKYHGATTVASVTKGQLNITGGEFSVEPYEGSYDYLLNCVDANYADGSAKITVTGGTFHGFNPENNNAEIGGANFCATNYIATEIETGVYQVEVDYIIWIKGELLAGRDVTLERNIVIDGSYIESIPAPTNGNGKYPNYGIFNVVGDHDVTFDLNGHTITYNGHESFQWNGKTYNSCTVAHGVFFANAGADLTIKDSVGTGKVTVYGLASGAYVASPNTRITINGGSWLNEGCATCGGTNIFMYPLQGGELYITGGHFEQALDAEGESYLLVVHGGEYANSVIDYSKTKMVITGGTFVGMNPEEAKYFQQSADNKLDMSETTSAVDENYAAEKNADGTYGVKPYVTVTFDSFTMVNGNELPAFTYVTNVDKIPGAALTVGTPSVTVNGVGEYEIIAEVSVSGINDYKLKVNAGKLTVVAAAAKIGEVNYATLADAIEACVVGDNTITLLADNSETVTIKQTEGVNITIDGEGKIYSGTIHVDGNGRPTGAETLTIQNVNFKNTTATTYAYFINAEKNAAGANSGAHNLTVDNCTFESTNWHYAIGTRQPYNLVVKNCTATNVYYLIYNPQGGSKITVEDCTVTGATYGIGAQKATEVTVKNYTYSGMAAGFYGRATTNVCDTVLENVNITTTLNGQPAITLWKNDDSTTSTTYTFNFKGTNVLTTPDGVPSFAVQTETNSPYVMNLAEEDATLKADADLKVTTDLTGCMTKYINGTWVVAKALAQNEQTEKIYDDINEALFDAESGQTVKLLQNVIPGATDPRLTIMVPADVTLNLNGKTVQATYVTAFGHIVDKSEDNAGLLKVNSRQIMLQKNNTQLPVNTTEGYKFVEVTKFNEATLNNGAKYVFQPLFETDAHELLTKGVDVTGVSVIVRVSWETSTGMRSQNFVYNDDQVTGFIDSYNAETGKYGMMFTLTLSGLESISGLSIDAVVVSNTGVEYCS